MSLLQLSAVGFLVFLIIIWSLVFGFKKSDENILRWTPLFVVLLGIVIFSWWAENLALQWVLVEATTLIGAVSISLSKTEKSIETAWKFLLLNSFGLGLAFIGILFISYGSAEAGSHGLGAKEIIEKIHTHENPLVEVGIWLAVFGYSAKLGLFPNHFWVSDTYSESPSQVSSLLASFLPVSVSLAILPFIEMDRHFLSLHFSASSGLLLFGILTMLYSLFTMVQTFDLRRLCALIALFHSGGLAILLYLKPNEKVIYYALAGNVLIKTLLFSCMGILRIDLGSRNLNQIEWEKGIQKNTLLLFTMALGMCFVLPISPFFIFDISIIKTGMASNQYFLILVPIFGIIAFTICLQKILPLYKLENRDFKQDEKKILAIRINNALLLLVFSITVGIIGIIELSVGSL